MNAKEKMKSLFTTFERGFNGVDIDPEEDDPESTWTRNYASAILEVVEPDDEARRYFDLDTLMDDLTEHVRKHFGAERRTGAKVRLVVGTAKSEAKPGECILHIRRRQFWGLSVECYRKAKPPKEKAKKAKAKAKAKTKTKAKPKAKPKAKAKAKSKSKPKPKPKPKSKSKAA